MITILAVYQELADRFYKYIEKKAVLKALRVTSGSN
jgi:hypothetical protein